MAKHTKIQLKNGETITLTELELLFCQYYISDANRNATQAAIKAGYSERTAKNIANQNLAKLHIQKYIYDQTAPILDALGASKERLLQEWVKIGLSDITDYLEDDWRIKNLGDIAKGATGAIESVQVDEKILMTDEKTGGQVLDRSIKFKLHNKIKALTTMSEIQGIIKPKENDSVPGTVNFNLFEQVNHYYNSK